MLSLLKCEYMKFKNTYINLLSTLGMLSPVILITLAYVLYKGEFIKEGAYNWEAYNRHIVELFVFLVGPLVTCFISVCSVFYEYSQRTMKNILISPHNRIQIVIAKVIFISLFIIFEYIAAVAANIICAELLGLTFTLADVLYYYKLILIAGISTIVLVPFMMLLTFVFKSFIPPMIIAVAGTVPNILAYHWDKCYISPWAAPEALVLILAKYLNINIIYPITSLIIYFIIFMSSVLIYFKTSDHHV